MMKTIYKHIIIIGCLIAVLLITTCIYVHNNNETTSPNTSVNMQKYEQIVYASEPTDVIPKPTTVFAPIPEGEDVDWKTCISTEDIDILNDLFDEYDSPETLYATTRVHMRKYPTINAESISILNTNTEVKAVGDFKGWTRVLTENGDHYYIWNQYLSDEKQASSHIGKFKLTAYCSCTKCCGEWAGGPTASGSYPVAGRTVAMAGVPFGTKLSINGHVYTVEDRGTPYGHVDIYFNSHEEALQFGKKYANVYIVE